ncbi:hypothetical protein EYF80_004368 [Liparis tanakae]|uniref:Uncharacterized protein n=1 Tax=Liparis tanakae TaxID=230148 RepID=A0A4Z2J595_9TELE|nr:hypothetical protein EYF80_004368 [Liparis tanakae]
MEMGPRIQGRGTEMNRRNNDPNFHRVTEHFSAGSFYSPVLCQKARLWKTRHPAIPSLVEGSLDAVLTARGVTSHL